MLIQQNSSNIITNHPATKTASPSMVRSASAGRAQTQKNLLLAKKQGVHAMDDGFSNLENTGPSRLVSKPNDYKQTRT